MSYATRQTISLTTNASGAATGYSGVVTGKVAQILYVKDGSTPFADGVDFTITAESTGEGIWTESNVNASKNVAPRIATHDNVGVAAVYAAGGSPVLDKICVSADRIKFVIAQGGDTKTGSFILIME